MGWRSLLSIGLLLVALATTWSAWQRTSEAPPEETAVIAERSDYVLHDFDLVSLNAEGEASFTLRAPLLRQTPGARTLELTTPNILIPRGAQSWEINADSGWISANSDEVRLRGGVVATPVDARREHTSILTEALDIFPQQDLATSDTVVTLTRPGATMHAVGMRAHLGHNRVELLSKVQLRYEALSR